MVSCEAADERIARIHIFYLKRLPPAPSGGPSTLFPEDLLHLADFLLDFPAYLFALAFGFQAGIVRQLSCLLFNLTLHFVNLARYLILADRVRENAVRLNPDIPAKTIDDALEKLLDRRQAMSLVAANQEIYNLLRDGIPVEFDNTDRAKRSRCTLTCCGPETWFEEMETQTTL